MSEKMQGVKARERKRDDRMLTSGGQRPLHINQLSWKINSLRYGQWSQQQTEQAAL